MENTILNITEGSKAHLLIISKWLKFFAILMFIAAAFMILFAIAMMALGSSIPFFGSSGTEATAFTYGFGAIYLLIGLLYIYPSLKMYHASNGLKHGITNSDQPVFDGGIKNLMQHFKFWGIASIVIIVLYALIFIGMIGYGIYNKAVVTDAIVEEIAEESTPSGAEEVMVIDSTAR